MCLKLVTGYLYMICFQILILFVGLTGITTGFLFDTKCAASPPCTCSSNKIDCYNKHISKIPVFTRHNGQEFSLTLDLGYNQLTTIPAYAFKNLTVVNATRIDLILYQNHISNIETHAFSGVESAVTYIRLQNNNLTHLPIALTELSSLHSLNLLNNPLVKIDASVLANISSSLNSLYISVNRFSSFPNDLQLLTIPSTLRIDGITFPMLHSNVFHSFQKSLTTLEMSYTNFESIPAAVCRLNSMEFFTSSYSPNLGRYNGSIFDECTHKMTNVTSLTLQSDHLRTIPKLANIFPSLRILFMYDNDLHFIESN